MSNYQSLSQLTRILLTACSLTLLFSCSKDEEDQTVVSGPKTLLNVSGMSWVEDDVFLVVHDIKNSGSKASWPRLSLCRLAQNEFDGISRTELYPQFPGLQASDLESICSIPGSSDFLLLESGQEGASYSRIFHSRLADGKVSVLEHMNWPVPVKNVEASEVCRIGSQLYFLYAERNDGIDSTYIKWAEISLNPLTFGVFDSTVYYGVDPVGPLTRAIVAFDIDEDGYIYSVSAYDSGDDSGPFRSTAWKIGRVVAGASGGVEIQLGPNELLGTFDGFKAEAIAVRPTTGGGKEVFIGTDDEFNGGLIRILP